MYILNSENTYKKIINFKVFSESIFLAHSFTENRKTLFLAQCLSPDGRENPFLIKREASFIKKIRMTAGNSSEKRV